MNQNIMLTLAEFGASLVLEGIILGIIFQMISNKASEKDRQHLQTEMNTIERQNRHNIDLIMDELREVKSELISQIKESTK
jgi:predicted phage tail protein